MSHRQILEAMTGLLAGLFTAMLSSTIVSTALPTIIGDLRGTQRQYTWVITASLLATTVSTPIWGKLSDLFSKKLLVQLSLLVFVAGSIAAGLSQSVGFLIACRVIQGLGMGGLTALTQSIMGAMIAPRQRGRYAGYMGAVMAVATVSGPLLGGLIVDSSLGWRWTFYVCIPLAVIALFILQATLHIVTPKRTPKIDYLGAGPDRGHRLAAPAVGHLRGQRLPVVVRADRLVPRRHARRPRPHPRGRAARSRADHPDPPAEERSPPVWSSSPAPRSGSRSSVAPPSSRSTSRSPVTTARRTLAC